MKYDIAYGISTGQLIETVNQWIDDGWKPLGNPFIDEFSIVCQAMIMENTSIAVKPKPNPTPTIKSP